MIIKNYEERRFSIGKVLVLVSLFLPALPSCAQEAADSIPSRYEFIRKERNCIENDSAALQAFYDRLLELEDQKPGVINVVHIGDSHIQADFFSGKIRTSLQKKFGNAGRGLLIPYRIARTNEPMSYRITSNTRWDARRNVLSGPIPIGVGGITIETSDTSARLNIHLKNQDGLNYSATKLILFHAKSGESYDFSVYDTARRELAYVRSGDSTGGAFFTPVPLGDTIRYFSLKPCPRDSSANCARIFGIVAANENPGILYHSIGVNGAEYRHYSKSEFFTEQLPALNPGLIIISLGTNEAYLKNFNKISFYSQIDTLVSRLRIKNPGAAILLSTPPDSYRKYRRSRVKNPDMKEARNTIIDYCLKNNLAYWDLYEIMGGYGSMGKWYSAGLAAKDRLHFSAKGYRMQGILFYNALYDSFQRYKLRVERKN